METGLDLVSRDEWNAFVRDHPDGTFFHLYEWLEIVREVYGGEPYYLAAVENGRLLGILPLMTHWAIGVGPTLISVPFSDVGGVCASEERAVASLLDAAKELGRRARVNYVDLRQLDHPLPGDLPCDLSRVVSRLALPATTDGLRQGLSRNMRKKLRRAARDGLVAHECGAFGTAPVLCRGGRASSPDAAPAAALDAFYDIYSRNMRDLGAPMHARRYFTAIATTFPGATLCVHVTLQERVIGAGFAVWFRDTLTVLCAHSLRRYHRVFPNNLLYWQVLESAIARGGSTADFGRSPKDSGTYEFKRRWGMADHHIHRTIIPVRSTPDLGERRRGRAYRAFAAVWRHTPMCLARAIGPRVFARIPI